MLWQRMGPLQLLPFTDPRQMMRTALATSWFSLVAIQARIPSWVSSACVGEATLPVPMAHDLSPVTNL